MPSRRAVPEVSDHRSALFLAKTVSERTCFRICATLAASLKRSASKLIARNGPIGFRAVLYNIRQPERL